MRRFIVICLILLFPLQVFADSAEDYPPSHMGPDDPVLVVAHASCTFLSPQHALSCSADLSQQQPAHLDFADILVMLHDAPVVQHDDKPALIDPPRWPGKTLARLHKPPNTCAISPA